MGICPNEEECSKRQLSHLYRTVLLGLCLRLASCLVSSFNLTGPWILLKRIAQPMGACSCLLQGGAPSLFNPQESLLAHVQTRKSSLTSGVGTFSLCFSRTQLLPLALSLECLGENKASVLLHLTNTSCPAQGPIYLLHHHHILGNEVCSLYI